jgi:hypothetical protein
MAVWLDIIGSFVFGALLVMNVLRMNSDMTAQTHRSTMAYAAQNSAIGLGQIVEEDLRKIGYGVTGTPVTLADSSQIRFLVDLTPFGSVDTVYYQFGSLVSHTINPNDRVLYRTLGSSTGSTTDTLRLGLTNFALSYFDTSGDSLALPVTLDAIRHIRLDLTVESTSPYDTTYAQAFMQLRIWPKNFGS